MLRQFMNNHGEQKKANPPKSKQKEFRVEKWLDFWATSELIKEIQDRLTSEKRESISDNYGCSFPNLTNIQQSCLEEIRYFYDLNGKAPRVADLGAGFGNMTWKLLAAGAEVDAFEIQDSAAKEIKKRLEGMKSVYWGGRKLSEIFHIINANILTALAKPEYQEKYDFIWMGSVLHFLNPSEVKLVKQLLQRVLKRGGKFFIQTNSIYMAAKVMENPSIIENAVQRAKQQGAEFPGFIACNSITLFSPMLGNRVLRRARVSALTLQEMQKLSVPPKTINTGKNFLGEATFTREAKQIVENFEKLEKEDVFCAVYKSHSIANYFDKETAEKVFKDSGFNSVQISSEDWGINNIDIIAQKSFYSVEQKREIGLIDLEDSKAHPSLLVAEYDNERITFRRPYSCSIFSKRIELRNETIEANALQIKI